MNTSRRYAIVLGVLAATACSAPQQEAKGDDVAPNVEAALTSAKACYALAVAKDPTVSGRVTVKFVAGTRGDITRVDATAADEEFVACIRAKLLSVTGLPIAKEPREFTEYFDFTR